MKAKYISDDSNIYGVYGIDSTEFAGLGFGYGITGNGSPYVEDYPDVIDTVGGSKFILQYNSVSHAGIAFTGSFSNSTNIGQLVYLAFPFETINLAEARFQVLSAALRYFGLIEPLQTSEDIYTPVTYLLNQNYPNPFNPGTTISYEISKKSNVSLKVYDMLGKVVSVLVNEIQNPGKYQVEFNKQNLASGIYFYRLEADNSVHVKKMILLK
ncbi:MAG: T9SS type A sorting domain-containing protein [Ignavibacteriaceae bacterium]|nr:T9SS type A sorting domain-containing protein [Ignavibacteriaceae bacterium]